MSGSSHLPPSRSGSLGAAGTSFGEHQAPRHYSLDQMMDSLRESRDQQDEEGELVTREDGTKVMRVRRRKRRSHQAKREREKKKDRQLVLFQILLLAFLVAGLLGYGAFCYLRLNTVGYEQKLEEEYGVAVGGKLALRDLRVAPNAVALGSLHVAWPESSPLHELQLRYMTGPLRFADFVKGRVSGSDLNARQGVLRLGSGWEKVAGPPESSGEVREQKSTEHGEVVSPFDLYSCANLAVEFGPDAPLKLHGADAALRYSPNAGAQLVLGGGELALQGWTPFLVQNATLKMDGQVADLVALRLQSRRSEGGRLQLAGHLPLREGEPFALFLAAQNFAFEELIGPQLARLFEGVVDCEQGVIKGSTSQQWLDEVSIPFEGRSIISKGLPLWVTLDEFFPDEGFLNPTFQTQASGILQVGARGRGIRNLVLRQDTRLQIVGNVVVGPRGELGGELELRINRGILSGHPQLGTHPLLQGEGGYAALEIRLSGSVEDPRDNLREQLDLDGRILPDRSRRPVEDFDQLFDQLTLPR